ncbi:hypothetical protein [Pseudoclavibacter sp. 13-3]|uniref:hypothetical protein n=1 Tax=Pseudoclavibacter sp. 13-3 TaxID=2901228 RepID=UPI001E5E3192|nr:hypothetical protein [Pseudoclavibacter sp. 13-3]MCD7101056.1 hypothetical protein [Pseudoclavibacter sp. 13-3]
MTSPASSSRIDGSAGPGPATTGPSTDTGVVRPTPLQRIARVTRLQLNVPSSSLLTPGIILALVFAVSVIVSLTIQRATGGAPSDPEFIAGLRNNSGAAWSLPGFLIYLGVASVSTTFPFTLALGSTRRSFTLGTLAFHLLMAVYVALLGGALLLLELATNHWFIGVYVFDTLLFGSGSLWQLLVTVFLGTLASLSIGGAFGAIWVRFGNKGPTIVAIALALVVALALLLSVPAWAWIGAHFALWWLAALAGVIIVIACLAQYLALRRASVR